MTQNRRPYSIRSTRFRSDSDPHFPAKVPGTSQPDGESVGGGLQEAQRHRPSSQDPDFDPRKRQRSDKEQFKAQRDMKEEIKGAYKTWLTQDVVWIITDEEARSFKSLSNDEERDAFIEQFWLRRNPNPDSAGQ